LSGAWALRPGVTDRCADLLAQPPSWAHAEGLLITGIGLAKIGTEACADQLMREP